jgi:hypothetical protein
MRPLNATRRIAVAALAALAIATAGSAAAASISPTGTTATWHGVGDLQFGRKLSELRAEGLVGRAGPGCILAPGEKVAPLRPPLEGVAHFYPGERLSALNLTGGAVTSTGVRVGSSAAQAQKAYPGAIYDPPPARIPTLPGYMWVGGRFHSRMTLVIGNHSRRVVEITIPHPSICE